MTEHSKALQPLQQALFAVELRLKAAEELFRAAVVEGDVDGMQDQRETLHALIDEKLDVSAGMLTKFMRGEM